MRIALINEFFPPFAPGGAEWSMQELAKSLAGRGAHTVVMTPNYGAPAQETVTGIHIYRFPFPKKTPTGRKLVGFVWHANPIYYLYSAFQIIRIAKQEKIELLHAQNKYSLVGAYLAGRFLGIPVVVSIRDTSHICRIAVCLHHFESVPEDCSLKKLLSECSEEYYENYYDKKSIFLHVKDKIWQIYHWWDVHLRRFCLNRVDAVLGVSQGILDVHEKSRIFKRSSAKRKAIYNFIDLLPESERHGNQNIRQKYNLGNSKIILYVGGFSRGKGTDNFVRAIRILEARKLPVQAVMIGSGRLKENGEGILMLQNIGRDETLKFYSIADVVVVPSTCQESLSRVILEAMAAGKPIVGTRVGGTPEAVLNNQNGFIVEREDSEALADAIQKIVSNAELSNRMGKRSTELISERFSREVVLREFEALYQDCVKG